MLHNTSGQIISDKELVIAVKENNDSQALEELCARHSGLYAEMVRRFSRLDSGSQIFYDMMDEKVANFWSAAKSYNEERGTAFNTYLADTVKWKCLSNNSKVLANKEILTDNFDMNKIDGEIDPSLSAETSNILDTFEQFVDEYPDKRLRDIVNMRLHPRTESSKPETWDDVGEKIGATYERARQIYAKAMKTFRQRHLKSEYVIA